MDFDDLKNPELQEKLKSAKTPEEILALANEEGYELSEEELNGVSGGWLFPPGCVDNTCRVLIPDY